MNKSAVIEMCRLEVTDAYVPVPDAYILSVPNTRFAKLWTYIHKWAIKKGLLKNHWERSKTIDLIRLDQYELSEYLHKAYAQALDSMYPKRPTHVYMGQYEFHTVTRNMNDRLYQGFVTFDAQLLGINHPTGVKVGGIQVTVVPYMKGVLIV